MPLTLKQHAYQEIFNRLMAGSVQPGGRLSDDALARELGISRSPVREAISQLSTEGLVEYRPRSGAYVKVLGRRELEELYDLREALEGHAAAKAAQRIDQPAIDELAQVVQGMREIVLECRATPTRSAGGEMTERFLANDLQFHMAILTAAGNQRLLNMVRDLRIMTRVFGFVPVEHDLKIVASAYRYHTTVLRALVRRDSAAAQSWMVNHIRAARKLVLAGYDRRAGQGNFPLAPSERE